MMINKHLKSKRETFNKKPIPQTKFIYLNLYNYIQLSNASFVVFAMICRIIKIKSYRSNFFLKQPIPI